MELGILNKIEQKLKNPKNTLLPENSEEDNETITASHSIGSFFNLNNNNYTVSTIDWLNSQYRI